jgi:hypothetical protein
MIDHMKFDCRVARNFLKGHLGDAMNTLLWARELQPTKNPQPLEAFVCPKKVGFSDDVRSFSPFHTLIAP